MSWSVADLCRAPGREEPTMHLVLIEFSPKAQDEVGFKYCHAVLDITKPLEPQVLEWYRAIYAERSRSSEPTISRSLRLSTQETLTGSSTTYRWSSRGHGIHQTTYGRIPKRGPMRTA